MANGTGLVPPGPTLASLLTAIKNDRDAHTDAESNIFGIFLTGGSIASAKPSIQALITANQALVADLQALLALI